MKLNRSRSLFWKLIKVALLSGAAMMFIVVVVTIASEDGDKEIVRKAGGSYDGVNLVEVKFEPEATGPQGEGTTNGLNLLLIDNIVTEGYVKEYLSYARMAEEGKLGVDGKVSVEAVLGTAVAEQGFYEGTEVPKSFIPINNGIISWNKSKKWTLTDIYKKDLDVYGGSVPTNPHAKNMTGLGGKDNDYIGPFQQTPSYFNNTKYKATTPNSTGKADGGFFPDQLGGLAWEVNEVKKKFPDLTDSAVATFMSGRHNAGSGSFDYQLLHGVHWTSGKIKSSSSDDYYKSAELFLKDFMSIVEKSDAYMYKEIPFHMWKFIALIVLLDEDGWYINSVPNLDYITGSSNKNNVSNAYKLVHPDSTDPWGEAQAKIKDRVKDFSAPHPTAYGRTSGAAAGGGKTPKLYKIRTETTNNYKDASNLPIVHEVPLETFGHMLSVVSAGKRTYATMLKYAGVNVDPTNPDDYMNKVTGGSGGAGGTGGGNVGPDGQWVPDASSTDWLRQAGVDSSKLTRGQVAVLNTLYRYSGSEYTWGGVAFPKKKCGHTVNQICGHKWVPSGGDFTRTGMDCADFVQMPLYDLTGDDWYKTTGGANITTGLMNLQGGADKRFTKIPKREDLQPGDVFVHTGHTGVFLKWDDKSKGRATILHAPGRRKAIGIDSGYLLNSRKGMTYLRYNVINEINNGTMTPKTMDLEWVDSTIHRTQLSQYK